MRRRLRTFIITLFLIFSFLNLSSCSFSPRNSTHILILAVDQFGYENLKCTKDTFGNPKSGLEILCQDSIRFTHAYTTSQQTRPAITSLLTARYPFSSGVQDNDVSFLEAKNPTLAKAAAEKGYETAFIIGSPFTLRNSGLQNGFFFFDDSFFSEKITPFRYFNESKNIYLSWRSRQSKPTFALIHIPDLFFKNRMTQTELGEQRNFSYESQLEELDFNLFQLIRQLKKDRNYDNTMIVFAGLNTAQKNKNITGENLSFNQDQIALLIKPTQKPRDLGLSWTYDENVSLADIGRSVFQFLNEEGPKDDVGLETISLFPNGINQHLPQTTSRWIVSETYSHFKDESVQISLRKDQFHLILNDDQVKIYNTLIDKLESSPLSRRDPIYQELSSSAQNIISKLKKNSLKSLLLEKQEDSFLLKKTVINQNICLQEIQDTSPKIQFKTCRDKKMLFLLELLQQSHEPSESQKKRISNLQNDLKNISSANRINQEINYPQAQPILELKRWLPFMVAIQDPAFSPIKNHFTKLENR